MEYRERNGHVDRLSQHQRKCPNCGSSSYVTRISMEYCPSCGIKCDYWGGGVNEAWQKYEARERERQQREREEEDRKWQEENGY